MEQQNKDIKVIKDINSLVPVGYGIYVESFILLIFNLFYLKFLGTNLLEIEIIDNWPITDKIAILTSSVIAIGFLYHIGYLTARRHMFTKQPPQYMVIFQGSLLFLGIFLPLLYFGLLDNNQRIFWFILPNIAAVILCGFFNETIAQLNPSSLKVTLIMTDAKETPNDNLEYSDVRDGHYVFRDENRNMILIPIGQVREIRFNDYKKL